MNDLEAKIIAIADKIDVIPPTRRFWVNRTEDGKFYDSFVDGNVIGLDIKDVPISAIDKIKRDNSLKNGKVDYLKAHKDLKNYFNFVYARELRETLGKKKKTSLLSQISLKTNQVYNFVFEVKKGDYVAIPSHSSENISIGRVRESFIGNSGMTHLQRSVDWIDTFKKREMDPVIFKAFSSHLAFYDISKYKDAVLRSLYDFYFLENEGNLVLNLGVDGNISFIKETRFLYNFYELFSLYLHENNLSFDARGLSTIVNLNSRGKRKLYGDKVLAFVAALFLVVALDGDSLGKKSYGSDLQTVVTNISGFLDSASTSKVTREDLIDSAKDMNVDSQNFFKKLLDSTNEKYENLENKQKRINSYY